MKTRKLLLTALSMMLVATSAVAFASCDKLDALKGAQGDKGDTGATGLPGQDGADGLTIIDISYDADGNLVFTYSDGSSKTVIDSTAHTHTYGDWTKFAGNNCEDSVFSRACTCGYVDWKKGLEHDWSEPTVVEATCSVKGTSTKVCTRCEEADVEYLLADHTFAEGDDAKETCTTCNYLVKGTTGLLYELKADGTYKVTGYVGNTAKVEIPGVVNNALVTEIDTNAFYGKAADGTFTTSAASMTSVVIPTSVTKIGNAAFAYSGLKKITIPDSVTDLGNSTFVGCPDLKSVTFGSGLTALGEKIFQASAIESVVLPNNITTLGTRAFYNCASLKTVKLGNAMTVMGQEAFRGCTALESINLENITEYAKQSLQKTTALKSVVVSANLTSLKNNIFAEGALETVYYLGTAEKFATVTIGSSGNDNFKNAIHYYSETEPTTEGKFWHYVDDVPTAWPAYEAPGSDVETPGTDVETTMTFTFELNADQTGYIVKEYTGTATEVIIPATYESKPVVEIYSAGKGKASAFQGKAITSVTIPGSITKMGDYAFYTCTALKSVTFQEGFTSTTSIYTFAGCTALETVNFPSTFKALTSNMFNGCAALKNVVIPEGVEELGYRCFAGCALESISLPSTLKGVAAQMFNKGSVAKISYNGTQAQWTALILKEFTASKDANNIYHNVLGDVEASTNAAIFEAATITFKANNNDAEQAPGSDAEQAPGTSEEAPNANGTLG